MTEEQLARARAVGLWAAAYLIGYGPYIFVSVSQVVSPAAPVSVSTGDRDPSGMVLLFICSMALALLAVAAAGAGSGVREWVVGRGRGRGWGTLVVLGLVSLGTTAQIALDSLVDLPDSSGSRQPTFGFYEVLGSVLAGVGEELVVVAAPVVVLRYVWPRLLGTRRGVVSVVAVLTVLRLLYHLYYGWGTVSLLPWAAASAAVYLVWGRIWPLILLHVAHDLVFFAGNASVLNSNVAARVEIYIPALFLGLGLVMLRRDRGTVSRSGACKSAAPRSCPGRLVDSIDSK